MPTIDPAAHLARVRMTSPLVHNITNPVAMATMANVLLALDDDQLATLPALEVSDAP